MSNAPGKFTTHCGNAVPAEAFRPALGLGNPHLQTLWGPLWRKMPPMARQRERIWLEDGDFLDLDWHAPANEQADAPLLLALHGLTGSSNSPYIAGLQRVLGERGWASVALNWRGCSGEPNLLPRSYHSGASGDLAEVIAHLQRKRPLAPLYVAGYSLGANVLLKYLGETGEASGVHGAVAVSVPFRLDHSADRIGRGFSRVYQAHFMRQMLAYVKDKKQLFIHSGQADRLSIIEKLGSLERMRTFWDFDGRVTAPLHGFKSAQDYYQRSSSQYFLAANRTPTLIIQAADDPFVFLHSVPGQADLAPGTELELHAKGGHVGFVEGSVKQPAYYLERRIPEWLANLG